MAKLDNLVNQTYPADTQYLGASILSGQDTPAPGPFQNGDLASLTVQTIGIGSGATSGVGERIQILRVNDTDNTITYDFVTSGKASGQFFAYVVGYDAATGSLLLQRTEDPRQIAGTIALNLPLSSLNATTSILSPNGPIGAGTTITYPAITAATVVGSGSGTPAPTPTPTTTGAGSTSTTLPVYRFFDSVFGTHLFTQSLTEARSILATRRDLTQETNGFSAVSQDSPSAEPVFRFFETTNGTHFFTSSASEKQGLVTPGSPTFRPDLTLEDTSTFYEHSAQQPGDVPVFRFFDQSSGTQFLTGSQSEFQTITTPGSGGFRADFTNEGVAFYAPSGSSFATPAPGVRR